MDAGTLKLVGTEEDTIFNVTSEWLTNQNEYEKMSKANHPYGDGQASEEIIDYINQYFNN